MSERDDLTEQAFHVPQVSAAPQPAEIPVTAERAWRKAIADQVRTNCTPPSEAYSKGGDVLIYAVADWIESPPEWSTFTAPADDDSAEIVRQMRRYLERYEGGAGIVTNSQRAVVESMQRIVEGSKVAWAPSDDGSRS
jgi:hypothetical protein